MGALNRSAEGCAEGRGVGYGGGEGVGARYGGFEPQAGAVGRGNEVSGGQGGRNRPRERVAAGHTSAH